MTETILTTEQLVEQYGFPKEIEWERCSELIKEGKQFHIFCTMCDDDDPAGADYGQSGMHIVNVMNRYEFPKELPKNLYVEDVNYFCFDEPGPALEDLIRQQEENA